jgi:hypothetical protein
MASGFGAGLGADMLQEILQRKFREAATMRELANREAMLSEQGRQANMRHTIDQGGLDLGNRRVGEDSRQFDAMEPTRIAGIGHTQASTAELQRKPQAEQEERAFTTSRDTANQDFTTKRDAAQGAQRMREIGARSGDSRGADWQIVQSVNPQTNETVSVRVNRQTGEAQPVSMPGGLQPGGAKQTRLSVSQQDDLATMETVQKLSAAATELGTKTNWKGVGGMGAGTVGGMAMKHLGIGDPQGEELRNYVGNIQGTIAKLRGGTAFSAQEKKMLDSYTPTIDDNPKVVQTKLKSLDTFINAKRDSTMKYAGGGPSPAASGGGGFKVVEIK